MSRKPAPPTLADQLREPLKAKSRSRNARDKHASEHERRAETIARRNDILPAHQIVLRPVVELVPFTRRLRKFGLDDIIEAANVISSFGFQQPLFISRDGKTLLDGELRLEAARWLQLDEVPCIFTETLAKTQERALRIALNRLGQRREWDMEELRLEIEELIVEDERIDLLGFDSIELDQIRSVEEEAEDGPDEPEPGPAVTRLGDVWILGSHRLICGEARDTHVLARLLGDDKVQLLATDPPYNIAVSTIVSTKHEEFAHASGEMTPEQFATFLSDFLTPARDAMVEGAIAFVFMDWRQIEILLRVGREAGLELSNLVTWVKSNAGMGSFYRSQHELVAVFKKPGQHKNRIQFGKKGRNRANVWFAPGAGTQGTDARAMLKEHPTSKPVRLLSEAIIDVTDPGDIVLDCFGGSGSTLIAAERTDRLARLIELDPGYCDLIVRRWQGETGKDAVLGGSELTFDEICRARLVDSGDQSHKPESGETAEFLETLAPE